MYKYILEPIENIDWLAVGPLVLFFVFFTVITISALRKKRSYIDKMGNLPLEDD